MPAPHQDLKKDNESQKQGDKKEAVDGKVSQGRLTSEKNVAEIVERQAVESIAADARPVEPPLTPIPQIADIKNIDIALDSYDDIFSDFDITPYAKRQLSEDFIIEMLRRVPASTDGPVKVVLSIPQAARDPQDEKVIQKRIRHVFSKKLQEIEGEIRTYQQKGLKYMLIGSVIILLTLVETDWLLLNTIFNILLVPGWFGIWTGLAKIFDEPADLIKAKKAYQTLSTAQYVFVSEEEVKKTLV